MHVFFDRCFLNLEFEGNIFTCFSRKRRNKVAQMSKGFSKNIFHFFKKINSDNQALRLGNGITAGN